MLLLIILLVIALVVATIMSVGIVRVFLEKDVPDLKDVTTRELFGELSKRSISLDVRIGDIPLARIIDTAPEWIPDYIMEETR